jgi:cytochrome b involved in lipid metabolism
MPKKYTAAEVSHHQSKNELYVIIHGKVYNISPFLDDHPGGEEALLDVAGQDATEAFEDAGHSSGAKVILACLLLGDLMETPEKQLSTKNIPTPMSRAILVREICG